MVIRQDRVIEYKVSRYASDYSRQYCTGVDTYCQVWLVAMYHVWVIPTIFDRAVVGGF